MKKVSLVVSKYLRGNVIFDESSSLNRDSIFNKYIELRKEFSRYGYDVSTCDINAVETADIVIYFDMPAKLPESKNNSYLILVESQLIRPDNYVLENHLRFKKVFTWRDDLVDNKKYYKLNFSHYIPRTINKSIRGKEKLCVLVAGNKDAPCYTPIELYYKRKKIIRWFEKYHSEDFDLFGVGWDRHVFKGPKLVRALNRVPAIGRAYAVYKGETYPSYQGTIENKQAVMSRYRFSICYENAQDIPGYITEKIFDSFFAGCVPIYRGANNIDEYIPKSCFIDEREFDTFEDLYEHIATISNTQYMDYLNNIERFLNSDKSYQFSGEGFAAKLTAEILEV